MGKNFLPFKKNEKNNVWISFTRYAAVRRLLMNVREVMY